MSFTVDQLSAFRDTLLTARVSGVREVTDQNGERISYKSDAEMAMALARLDRLIAEAATPPVPQIIIAARKGIR